MPRIPEEELARLKAETDLAALVRAAGVDLAPVGADLRGKCPFHDDHGPSLVVTPSKNLWHCLGACGAGGSPIDWVMKSQGVSFRHAVEILRTKTPLAAAAGIKQSTVRHLPPPVAVDADDQKLLDQVVDFYHDTLTESPEALAYLEGRSLKSSELVTRFKLGYANRTLGYRLPERNRKAGFEIRGRLEKLGIYRASGHEHFAGSLVVPIFDEAGHVAGIYGRKITDGLRAGTPLHLYLPGPHKGVWNIEALQASREIILCEALIDAMTFWCAGFRNVTASYGVHGWTGDHLAAFKKYGVERVMIAYDRDEAGDKAAETLAPQLAEAGFDVARILFPRGMDANEYAQKVTPPSESLAVLIRSAVFVRKGERASPATRPAEGAPAREAEPGSASTPQPSPLAAFAVAPPSEAALRASAAAAAPSLAVAGDQADLAVDDRSYRVRGLSKNLSHEQLRVNVRVSRGDKYHVDTFDLFSARQRQLYIKQAADELAVKADVVKRDVGKLLFELEALQERRIEEALAPKAKEIVLSETEKAEAFDLLRDPDLLARIVHDFEKVGVIGEETNKLVGYLAAVSRKMEEPLALLLQSNSAAGKSALMDAVLSLMPEEEVERFTALTGQSLYYMADASFKHKILAIAEVAGAEKAGYAIKMLQSEGRISIATTIKDPETGQLRTKKHEVEGPVAVMLTTTEASIDEELQNRAVVLTVNEEREQTRAIHEAQRRRETLEGMLARSDREAVKRLHRNAQRLLKPLVVVNPWAKRLTFLDTKLRARRDHMKYLTLIRAVALLFQYQRPVKHVEHKGRTVPYLEATLEDVAIANRLAGEVLGRSLDELAPQTRRLLMLADRMVTARAGERSEVRFTRRELREFAAWSDFQVAKHLERLVELEYVLVHRGGRGQSFVYELLYDGQGKEGGRFIVGLLDPSTLTTPTSSPLTPEFEPPTSPHLAPIERGYSPPGNGLHAVGEVSSLETRVSAEKTHGTGAPPEKPVVVV